MTLLWVLTGCRLPTLLSIGRLALCPLTVASWVVLMCCMLCLRSLLHVLNSAVSSRLSGTCVVGVKLGLCWSNRQATWSPWRLTRVLGRGRALLDPQNLPAGKTWLLSTLTCLNRLVCLQTGKPCIVSKWNLALSHRLGDNIAYLLLNLWKSGASWTSILKRAGLGPCAAIQSLHHVCTQENWGAPYDC